MNNLITSTDIAKEIIEDLLNIVFGEEETFKKEGETVSDFVIDNNFEQLRKKVFVKEKIAPTKKIMAKKNGGASTFKKSNLSTAGHDSIESNITVEESKLTALLDSSPSLAEGEFLLPNPDENESIKIKIYMLETKHL